MISRGEWICPVLREGLLILLLLGGLSFAPQLPAAAANIDRPELLKQCKEGVELLEQNKFQEAADKLKSAMEIDPPDYDAQFNYVRALMGLGQWKQSIPIVQKIALAKAEDPEIWATLGNCYAQSSEYAKAADAYGKAMEYTGNEHAKAVLSDLLLSMYKELDLLAVQGYVGRGGRQWQSSNDDYYEETIATGFGRWPKTKPVRVYVSEPGRIVGYRPAYMKILKESFAEWTRVTDGKLNFTYVETPQSADIVCYWNGSRKDIRNKAELGHSAIACGGEEGISKVQIVFVIDPPRPNEFLPENHFRKVALHEIGHSIGLIGHSPNRADIMYPLVEDSPKLAALSPRDIATVQRLYTSTPPPRLAPLQKKAPGTVASTTPVATPPVSLPANVSKQGFEVTYSCTSPKTNYIAKFTYDGKGNLLGESGEGKAKAQFMYFKSDGGNYFIADDRKIAMKVAGKPDDFDVYICEWNKHAPPKTLTPIGTKVIDGHPCHGYRGDAGAINGEFWLADDLGVPVLTSSTKYDMQVESKLVSFRKLAPAETPEIAIPYGYKVTSAASYVENYEPDIPSDQ